MDVLLGRVETILQQTAEVFTYSRRTGFSLGGDISESNNGDFFIRLKPLPRQSLQKVMENVRTKITQQVPGLDIDPAQLIEDLLGDLTGKPEPVVVNLFADDESVLTDLAEKVSGALQKVNGLSSVESGVIPAGDAIEVHIDRVKASLEGVDPDGLTKSLNDVLAGTVTSQIQQGEKLIDVRLWTPPAVRKTTEDLARINLRAPDGHLFPLGRVASFSILAGQPEITREDLKRVVYVTARSSRDLGSTIRDVKTTLDQAGLIPPGVRYTLGGQYQQQQAAFKGLVKVIAAAASLVFLLLLFLYEKIRVAVAIMIVAALAVASVFIGLRLTGTELNISSMMGTVMIVGKRDGNRDFLLLRIRGDLKKRKRHRSVDCCRQRAIAGHHNDDRSRNSRAAPTRAGSGSLCWNASTACHCHHHRPGGATTSGADCFTVCVAGISICPSNPFRRIAMKKCFLLAVAAGLVCAGSVLGEDAYTVQAPIHIGGPGRWDYVSVDSDAHRLYVTRSTHTQVIDLTNGKVLLDVPGQQRNHGAVAVPKAGRGFITDGKAGTIVIFDLKTGEVLGNAAAADDADGEIYDAGSDKVLATCGDAGVMVALDPSVDPKAAKAESVDLGGKPEFLAADGKGTAYACVNDKNEIAVVDIKSMKVTARYPTGTGTEPTGLAIDAKNGRLFIGCHNDKMIVLNTADGKVLAELPIGKGNDALRI